MIGTSIIVNCRITGTVSEIITVFCSDSVTPMTFSIYYVVCMQYFKHIEFKHCCCVFQNYFSSRTHMRSISVSSITEISSSH
jgi:hypothetical protein